MLTTKQLEYLAIEDSEIAGTIRVEIETAYTAGATSMRDSIVEWLRSEEAAQSDSLQCSDDYADEIERRFK